MTFLGKSYATKGFQFYYQEPKPECPPTCTLYETCQQNLAPNTVYEVVEILERVITCPEDFHEEEMVLVKIKKPALFVSMHNKDIYEGSIVEFQPVGCDHEDCTFYKYCQPHTLMIQRKQKAKIVQRMKKIKNCPRGLHLSVVRFQKKG